MEETSHNKPQTTSQGEKELPNSNYTKFGFPASPNSSYSVSGFPSSSSNENEPVPLNVCGFPSVADSFTFSSQLEIHDVKDIFFACANGDLELLKQMITQGENVNQMKEGSPLHWACYGNNLECVKYLLDQGALIDIQEPYENRTPLMCAVSNGYIRIVHYLIEQKADITKVDKKGYNALHYAIKHDRLLIANLLISKGICIDSKDNENHTPLMWASYGGNENSIRYLISKGADINYTDNTGFTALHWAASKGKIDSIRTLLEFNPILDVKDEEGRTPSSIAQERRYFEIVKLLQEENSNIFKKFLNTEVNEKKYKISLFWFTTSVLATLLIFSLLTKSNPFIFGLLLSGGGIYFMTLTPLKSVWPRNQRNPFFVGIVITTYLISVFAYFSTMIKYTNFLVTETILFFLCNVLFMTLYLKVLFSDPGFVPKNKSEWILFLETLESGQPLPGFCLTCNIRKPLRSKHCRQCHRCVARMDHHCDWINLCVGIKNNPLFLGTVVITFLGHIMFARLIWVTLSYVEDAPSFIPINYSIPYLFNAEPLLCILFVFHCFNVGWQIHLVYGLALGVKKNMTINETLNFRRYDYFRNPQNPNQFHNPFDKGSFIKNLKALIFPEEDWFTLFTLSQYSHSNLV